MIDFVHLSTDIAIPEEVFLWHHWSKRILKTGNLIWYHRHRGVWIRYYPETNRLIISGKLLILLEDTEVLNVDDIYGTDLDRFVSDVNIYLNSLFSYPFIDISNFHVSRIDYCFNVVTPYVSEYISFMNNAFKLTNSGNRVNFTLRNHLDGSVYIKTKSDYEHNERRNYALNFYNKTDRLTYQRKRGHRIPKNDFDYAQNILRLEVQCGFLFIKHLCKHFSLSPIFMDLLNYDVAVYAESEIYQRIFHCNECQDFFTYAEAKKRIPRKEASIKALHTASLGGKLMSAEFYHGRTLIKQAGVFPFCFLKKKRGIDILINPIKLIRQKLQSLLNFPSNSD